MKKIVFSLIAAFVAVSANAIVIGEHTDVHDVSKSNIGTFKLGKSPQDVSDSKAMHFTEYKSPQDVSVTKSIHYKQIKK